MLAVPDFVNSRNHVVRLVPESSGRYLAIHCSRGVAVMKLHHHRGKHGEFSGGGESVICRSVKVTHFSPGSVSCILSSLKYFNGFASPVCIGIELGIFLQNKYQSQSGQ